MVLRSPEGEARARGVAAAGILVGVVGGWCARGPGAFAGRACQLRRVRPVATSPGRRAHERPGTVARTGVPAAGWEHAFRLPPARCRAADRGAALSGPV